MISNKRVQQVYRNKAHARAKAELEIKAKGVECREAAAPGIG